MCRDVGDLRRIQQLLVTSLQKVRSSQDDVGQAKPAYNESTLTMEKLAVLRAWAEVSSSGQEGRLMDRLMDRLIDRQRINGCRS